MRYRAALCLLCAGVVLTGLLTLEEPARGARPYKYPWPFAPSDKPHPVANLFHTPLRPGTTKAYFHGGIDIRKPRGTKVLAVADGKVRIYRGGAFDNVVLTQKDGRHWEYRHLKPDSAPEAVRKAAAEGSEIKTGAVIGEVGAWGGPYDHLHLNRREKDGRIVDPLFELIRVKDTVPAVIESVHLVPDGGDTPFEPDADGIIVTVQGKVDVVVTAIDRMDGETWGNPPPTFQWRINTGGKLRQFRPFVGGLPLEPVLPVPRYPRGYGLCVYLMKGPLACRNQIPRSPEQRFSIVITNVDETTKPARAGCWDTRKFPDGVHSVMVRARDHGGNWTTGGIIVRVANGKDGGD